MHKESGETGQPFPASLRSSLLCSGTRTPVPPARVAAPRRTQHQNRRAVALNTTRYMANTMSIHSKVSVSCTHALSRDTYLTPVSNGILI
eukprot:379180-Pleurochrysis_carterae.AAC.2